MKRAFPLACFLALLGGGWAQEGHPLSGTWSGDWGTSTADRHHITLVLTWDGKSVSGILNPGPDSVALQNIYLDVSNWTVRLAAEKPVHIAAEGQLADLGSSHRSMKGTWTQGTATGDFRLTRE